MTREQRQLSYLAIMVELLGISQSELEGRPADQVFLILLKASEERGVTLEDIQGWMAICDPEGTEPGPGDDPVGCFRQKAELALKQPPSLGATIAVCAAVGIALSYGAIRWFRG